MSNIVPISDIERMAQAVAKSRLFGVENQEQAFALMCVAQAEGMHPAIAARDYHIIKGRPSLKADAMLARFQTAGGSVSWKALTETKAVAVFSHKQGGSVEIEWTMEMAKRAGLASNDNWRKFPRAMLRARCISEGIRTVFPGVVAGYYTPEEVEDMPAQEMRDVTPAETTPQEKPARKSRMAAIVEQQPEVIDGEIIPPSVEYDLDADCTALRECEVLDALKDVFGKAWNACPADSREALKAVYDECKAKLMPADEAPV